MATPQDTRQAFEIGAGKAKARLLDLSASALDRIRFAVTGASNDTLSIGLQSHAPEVLFPVGSITKLFVATALARWLQTTASVSLDTPVDDLLGEHSHRKVTLGQLVTHTAGLDCVDSGLVSAPGEKVNPARPRYVPRYVARPGGLPAYSNYGAALVARILERAHGAPIAHILRRDVFDPLQMHSVRFADRETALARLPGQSPFTPMHPFYHAAGAAACSTEDALRFARFVLAATRSDTDGFLTPEASRLLTSPLVGARDGFLGVGVFFTFIQRPGLHLICHTGSWIDYAAFLAVLPEHGIGLFATMLQPQTSSITPDRAWGALIGAFSSAKPVATSVPEPSAAIGRYVSTKHRVGADRPLRAFESKDVISIVSRGEDAIEIVGAGRLAPGSSIVDLAGEPSVGLSTLAMTFDTDAQGRTVLWRGGQREAHVRTRSLTPPTTRRVWAGVLISSGLAAIGSGLMQGAWAPLAACGASAAAWAGLTWQSRGLRTLQGDRRGVQTAKLASWVLLAATGYAAVTMPLSAGPLLAVVGCGALAAIHAAIGLFRINLR